jgi:hypothetical protein
MSDKLNKDPGPMSLIEPEPFEAKEWVTVQCPDCSVQVQVQFRDLDNYSCHCGWLGTYKVIRLAAR